MADCLGPLRVQACFCHRSTSQGKEARLLSYATLVGLIVALCGPTVLFTPAHKLLGRSNQMTRVLELLYLWLLAGSVLAITLLWERLPVSSIGLRLRWQSVILGLLLALFFNRVVSPFLYWVIARMGSPGFEVGLARMVSMPVWFLLFAALTAGVVEETLFRGYAIERLASVTESFCWAGLIVTVISALLHWPAWGWGPVVTFFVSGGVMAVFYIYTRDLVACMIAHSVTDAVGFLTARKVALASRPPSRPSHPGGGG